MLPEIHQPSVSTFGSNDKRHRRRQSNASGCSPAAAELFKQPFKISNRRRSDSNLDMTTATMTTTLAGGVAGSAQVERTSRKDSVMKAIESDGRERMNAALRQGKEGGLRMTLRLDDPSPRSQKIASVRQRSGGDGVKLQWDQQKRKTAGIIKISANSVTWSEGRRKTAYPQDRTSTCPEINISSTSESGEKNREDLFDGSEEDTFSRTAKRKANSQLKIKSRAAQMQTLVLTTTKQLSDIKSVKEEQSPEAIPSQRGSNKEESSSVRLQPIQTKMEQEDSEDAMLRNLLGKVNMDNKFLKLATGDSDLIREMIATVDYQDSVRSKRDRLMFAIVNNVHYLQELHHANKKKLDEAQHQVQALSIENERLNKINGKLLQEWENLKHYKEDYTSSQEEITQLLFASKQFKEALDSNRKTIDQQHEEIERLNLEITVINTEKTQAKKETDLHAASLKKLTKDFKEMKINQELMIEEVANVNKQNGQYRSLVLENESQLQNAQNEIQNLQDVIWKKEAQCQGYQEETQTLQKQVEKLLEELRDKSDSESFEDEKEKLLNVQKAMETEQLREKVKRLQSEVKTIQQQAKVNKERLEEALKQSRKSNVGLNNDYELLQEKLDKQLKATHSVTSNLKEELQELTDKNLKLQVHYDDTQNIMAKQKKEAEERHQNQIDALENALEALRNEKAQADEEIGSLKQEISSLRSVIAGGEVEEKTATVKSTDSNKSDNASQKSETYNENE